VSGPSLVSRATLAAPDSSHHLATYKLSMTVASMLLSQDMMLMQAYGESCMIVLDSSRQHAGNMLYRICNKLQD